MKKKMILALALVNALVIGMNGVCYASPWGGGQDVNKPNSVIEVDDNAPDNSKGSGAASENRLVQGSEPVGIIGPSEKKPKEEKKVSADVSNRKTPAEEINKPWFNGDNIITPEPAKRSPTDFVDSSKALYSYNEMTEDITALQEAYGDIIEVRSIGTTADRRKIYDIVTGDIGADKQMIIQASCHGREYMTSLLVMEQLEYALNNYDSVVYGGRTARECFKGIEVHIIPMLNPDGVSISQYGKNGIKNPVMRLNLPGIYKNNVKWRYTNLNESSYYRRWKANGRGVDINRNFDGRWKYVDDLRGTSAWGYKGREAESESETKALCDLTRSLSNPVSAISYHATGSVIWWDYGQTGEFAVRCQRQARVIQSLTGYDFVPRDPESAGGYCDWIIEKCGGRTVPTLIEIGKKECPLSISEYPDIWKRNKNVLFAVANNS